MPDKPIALAVDHAGFELKNNLKGVLDEHGIRFLDLRPEAQG